MATPQEAGYEISSSPVYEDSQIARYATSDPTILIEMFTIPREDNGDEFDFSSYINSYSLLRHKLLNVDMESYIPEIVDYDLEDRWVAFGIESGLFSLESVRASFPYGINERDWAWIGRRILMIFEIGNRKNNLVAENVLIHPEGHGITLLGWHPVIEPNSYALEQLTILMEDNLVNSWSTFNQIKFMRRMAAAFKKNRVGQDDVKIDNDLPLFGYTDAINEYTIKLNTVYGPPKYRELVLDLDYSTPYLRDESQLVSNQLIN